MIVSNLKSVLSFVAKLEAQNKRALARSAKKTLTAVYNEGFKIAKDRYSRLQKNKDNEKFKSFATQTTKSLQTPNMQAVLKAATRPVSLIHTVVGSRAPRKQKGIKVKSRKPIYVKVGGAKKKLGPNQLIASPLRTRAADVTQVFHKTKQGLVKETYSSLFDVLQFPENQDRLEKIAMQIVEKEYDWWSV